MTKNQQAEVTWAAEGVPVSTRFDDPYYSLSDGLAETRHVFLDGNDLAPRLAAPIRIAELGFGTGLNLLATLQLRADMGAVAPLRYTSFEAFPLAAAHVAQALARFPEVSALAEPLLAGLAAGQSEIDMGRNATLVLQIGDARELVPVWDEVADAWFLDGFAPAKNPELWQPALMAAVGQHTVTGGTFATYTAAGAVRRSLAVAGFDVMRVPGYGRKRHMTRGIKR